MDCIGLLKLGECTGLTSSAVSMRAWHGWKTAYGTLGQAISFPDSDGIIHTVGERLTPPGRTKAPDWQARYDAKIEALKAAGEDDPLGGYAFLYGYYWISLVGEAEPVIALFCEDCWAKAGEDRELPETGMEIIDGPFRGPLVQVADPSEEDDLDADDVDLDLAADFRTSQAAVWRRRLH